MRYWLVVCIGLVSSPGWAEKRIAVAYHGLRFLGLSPTEEQAFRGIITDAVQASQTLTLVSDQAEVSDSCGRDIHCHCRVGREKRAQRALFGNMGRMGQIFTFELVFIDTQSCSIANSAFVSESHDASSARARLAALTKRLVTPLESVAETVVKDERDVDAVPATVTVFTAKQIRELGITSLEELFRIVPGFEVIDHNWGNRVMHLGLTNTILFLIDGIPLSNPMFNFTDLGKDISLSLNHVERVEFVRGPGSVLWGPNALLGMVNIITRMPTETSPRVTAQASYGTLSTGDFHGSVEQSHRWFRYHVSGTVHLSQGPQTLVPDSLYGNILDDTLYPDKLVWGNAGTTQNESDLYYDVMLKLEVLRRLQFLFNWISHEDKYQISPFGSLLPPGQGGVWQKWHRLYGLAWEDSLPHGFRYRISGSRYEYRFWESYVLHPAFASVLPAGLRVLQGNEVDPQVNHLAEARLYHRREGRSWAHQALLGLAYLHQRMPTSYGDMLGVVEQPTTLTPDIQARSFQNVAAFVQEELSWWKWLLVSGGLRWEHRDPKASVLSGQGALIARTRRVTAKLIYAEGFRPPEVNQLYSTVGVEGNPDLRPETSRALSAEVGVALGPVRLKGGLTRAWVLDQIIQTDDPTRHSPGFTSKPYNTGSTNILAAYGEVQIEWPPLLSTFINYTYKQLSESDPVGTGIALAPHTAGLGLSLRPVNDLSFFASAAFVSGRDVMALAPGSPAVPRHIGPTWDLSLGFWLTNVFDQLDLGLKLQNPFGFTHDSPDSVTGNPNYFIEHRRVSEVLLTARWSSALHLLEPGGPRQGGASGAATRPSR
jgi:outer membrane receptor protein involved in Fe transport